MAIQIGVMPTWGGGGGRENNALSFPRFEGFEVHLPPNNQHG